MSRSDRPEALRIEVTIAAPIDAVWRALRDPSQIRRWHGWHADTLDDEIELIFQTGAHEGERPYVLEVEPDDVFELEEAGQGTVVRIIRSTPDPGSEWAAYFDDVTEGWISFTQQLRFMLERQPDAPRRTLFLSADRSSADPEGLVASSPASGGEPWFAAEHQRGVIVDDLGPGLLVVGVKPDGAGAMAILTTYHQDDAALATTQERWDTWWRSHHPDAQPAQR